MVEPADGRDRPAAGTRFRLTAPKALLLVIAGLAGVSLPSPRARWAANGLFICEPDDVPGS